MKIHRYIGYLLVFGAFMSVSAQTQQVISTQDAINKILADSGKHFREGLIALKANKRSESAEKFDKAVETFLVSPFNIQSDQKLQACYSQLLETTYRLEFPSNQNLPQIRPLSAPAAGWNEADYHLADEVAQMARRCLPPSNNAAIATATGDKDAAVPAMIWSVQFWEFEPSRDDLSGGIDAEELDIEGNRSHSSSINTSDRSIERSLAFRSKCIR